MRGKLGDRCCFPGFRIGFALGLAQPIAHSTDAAAERKRYELNAPPKQAGGGEGLVAEREALLEERALLPGVRQESKRSLRGASKGSELPQHPKMERAGR